MTNEEKITTLKKAIDKLLHGISFALDENYTRKAVSRRLQEVRAEAIKILKEKQEK